MKYSTFEILCQDLKLEILNENILEAFYISSRFDKDIDSIKNEIENHPVIRQSWENYLEFTLRNNKDDFSLNLPSFIESLIR